MEKLYSYDEPLNNLFKLIIMDVDDSIKNIYLFVSNNN